MPKIKNINAGKCGTMIGFNFQNGGKAEIILGSLDLVGILYELKKQRIGNKKALEAIDVLVTAYSKSAFLITFDAQIGQYRIKFEPIPKSQ